MTDYRFPPPALPDIPPLDDRLSPAQAAKLIGVSVHTLRNWRSDRKGPAFFDIGKIFYTRSDIAAWFVNRRVNQR